MPETRRVFVGLGSNDQRETHLPAAVARLRDHFGQVRLSPVYESPDKRFGGPAFYNLVVEFDSDWAPAKLRQLFREIEASCGRVARRERSFPLDMDLLLCGDEVCSDPPLPHPDILNAPFVLKPLVDLAPALASGGVALKSRWEDISASADLRRVRLRL